MLDKNRLVSRNELKYYLSIFKSEGKTRISMTASTRALEIELEKVVKRNCKPFQVNSVVTFNEHFPNRDIFSIHPECDCQWIVAHEVNLLGTVTIVCVVKGSRLSKFDINKMHDYMDLTEKAYQQGLKVHISMQKC